MCNTGGGVVHSYGRLIPHEFPITDLQQIAGPDGIGKITCTFTSGIAELIANSGGPLTGGGVTKMNSGTAKSLLVNLSNIKAGNFRNRGIYCTNTSVNSFFYLFLSSASKYTLFGIVLSGYRYSIAVVIFGDII